MILGHFLGLVFCRKNRKKCQKDQFGIRNLNILSIKMCSDFTLCEKQSDLSRFETIFSTLIH